MQGLEER